MSQQHLPFVSVIMPIRNEAEYVERSLSAVLRQDYPADRFEVIVADGISTDGTLQMIQQIQSKWPQLRLVENPGKIVATGLNAAISRARGEVIVRVDGHSGPRRAKPPNRACEVARPAVVDIPGL